MPPFSSFETLSSTSSSIARTRSRECHPYSELSVESVRQTVQQNPNIAAETDSNGNTLVHTYLANLYRDVELLRFLLDIYPEAALLSNCEGMMPIHLACKYFAEDEYILKLISRAKPEALLAPVRGHSGSLSISRNLDGAYPIHIALANGISPDALSLLIEENPAILHQQDNSGSSPLCVALKNGASSEIIDILLDDNDELAEVSDEDMNLPLHIAYKNDCDLDIIVSVTIAYPDGVHMKNREGLTPQDMKQKSRRRTLNDLMSVTEERESGKRVCMSLDQSSMIMKNSTHQNCNLKIMAKEEWSKSDLCEIWGKRFF